MVLTNFSWPGTSMKTIDRHAPLFFLGQGVGIGAGQGLDERGFAVVNVPGRADDEVRFFGHRRRL
jgi:hypothetical protein